MLLNPQICEDSIIKLWQSRIILFPQFLFRKICTTKRILKKAMNTGLKPYMNINKKVNVVESVKVNINVVINGQNVIPASQIGDGRHNSSSHR